MLSSHKTFNFKLYFFSCIIEKQFPNLYISHEILKNRARCSHMKESEFSSAFRSPRRPHWLLREWQEVLEENKHGTLMTQGEMLQQRCHLTAELIQGLFAAKKHPSPFSCLQAAYLCCFPCVAH